MALQFDGNGSVNIPQWTETGDFSITIPSFTYENDSQIILASNLNTQNFIACIPGGIIRLRIDGLNIEVSGAVAGQTYNGTFSRTGSTVTVDVPGLGSSSGSSTAAFPLNAFGKYDGGILKYEGLITGNVTITGDNNLTRTYNFEQPVGSSTLPDDTDSQDGTLTGFTTGGFIATGTLSIDTFDGFTATDYFCKQRDGSNQATITVAGSYTGAPTSIEYQLDTGSWSVLDAAPTGGTFSGSVTVTNQQDISVRFSDNALVNDSLAKITAAMCVAVWWQSNTAGRGNNLQNVTVGGGNPTPVMYKDGSGFLELTDPTGTDGPAAGSVWPRVVQQYSDAGVPICIGNVAVGGTSITQWQKGGANYTAINDFATACQGMELTISIGGETDSSNGMSTSTMVSNLTTMLTDLNTDFGTDHYLVYFPVGSATGTPTNVQNIRDAFTTVINDNAFVRNGGDLSVIDISDGDNLHLKTDAHLNEAGDIIYLSVAGSALTISSTGVPDGTYDIVLWQDDRTVLYSGVVTFVSNVATIQLLTDTGTLIRGATYDNTDPSALGMWVQGVTI